MKGVTARQRTESILHGTSSGQMALYNSKTVPAFECLGHRIGKVTYMRLSLPKRCPARFKAQPELPSTPQCPTIHPSAVYPAVG